VHLQSLYPYIVPPCADDVLTCDCSIKWL